MVETLQHDWPEIAAILVNHDAQAPDPVSDLDGRWIGLPIGAEPVVLEFGSGTLTWHAAGDRETYSCTVWKARDGIYFIRFDKCKTGHQRLAILALEPARLLDISIVAPIPGAPDGVGARMAAYGSQSAAAISYRHGGDSPFGRSTALIGNQYRYRYSDTHLYDHFYLSERYYTWFCRQGPDAGLGDFEECDHFAIAEDMVLVCWREKLLPCVGITLEDHRAMRSLGCIYGADSETGATQGAIVSAAIHHIARIDHAD